jgi:hypothetical protein
MLRQPMLPNTKVFGGVVTAITVAQKWTWISITGGNQMNDFALKYDHPGYSSIYTLLMASAVNQKTIYLTYGDVAAGESMAAIQEAQISFD